MFKCSGKSFDESIAPTSISVPDPVQGELSLILVGPWPLRRHMQSWTESVSRIEHNQLNNKRLGKSLSFLILGTLKLANSNESGQASVLLRYHFISLWQNVVIKSVRGLSPNRLTGFPKIGDSGAVIQECYSPKTVAVCPSKMFVSVNLQVQHSGQT